MNQISRVRERRCSHRAHRWPPVKCDSMKRRTVDWFRPTERCKWFIDVRVFASDDLKCNASRYSQLTVSAVSSVKDHSVRVRKASSTSNRVWWNSTQHESFRGNGEQSAIIDENEFEHEGCQCQKFSAHVLDARPPFYSWLMGRWHREPEHMVPYQNQFTGVSWC